MPKFETEENTNQVKASVDTHSPKIRSNSSFFGRSAIANKDNKNKSIQNSQKKSTYRNSKKIQRIVLPKHSHSEIMLSNKLCNLTYNGKVTISSKQYDVEYLPKFSKHLFQFSIGIQCSINEESFALFLNTELSKELFSNLLPIENIPDLDKALKISLVEHVLQPLLDFYSYKSDTTIKIVNVLAGKKTSKLREHPKYAFSFILHERSCGLACLYAKNESKITLIENIKKVSAYQQIQNNHFIDQIKVKTSIILGEISLPASLVKSLGLDDILIVKNGSTDVPFSITAYIQDKYTFKASLEKTTVKIQSKPEMIMEEELISDESENTIENIDDLDIKLTFEIGKKYLSLNQIKSLSPGHAFELENDATAPVNIYAGKRLIAIAELLDIDGNIGARVKEIIHGLSR